MCLCSEVSRSMPLAGMLLFTCVSLLHPQTQLKTSSSEREALKDVLIQGRDAVIQVAAKDTSSFNSMISEKVQKLVDSFLYLGDREDVRYLQRHLKKVYADNIAHVREPQPTPDEALAAASHSSSSTTRSEALAAISIRQYKDGQKSEGNRTLELAVQACLQSQDDTSVVDSSPQTNAVEAHQSRKGPNPHVSVGCLDDCSGFAREGAGADAPCSIPSRKFCTIPGLSRIFWNSVEVALGNGSCAVASC